MVLGVVIAESTMMGGLAGLLGVLALVAAEALWHGRPWAFRASVVLAFGCFFGLTEVLTIVAPYNLTVAGPLLGLSLGGMSAALLYIRRQIASRTQVSSQTRIAVPRRVP